MLWLSLALTMIDWAYYYFFYINVNYNTPDRFYFTFMPAAIYLFSLVYMGVRYMNMADRISEHATHPDAPKPMMTMAAMTKATKIHALVFPLKTLVQRVIISEGSFATIPMKISREMPFPIPFSLIRSPSHIIRAVPAVRQRMMVI